VLSAKQWVKMVIAAEVQQYFNSFNCDQRICNPATTLLITSEVYSRACSIAQTKVSSRFGVSTMIVSISVSE